MATQGARSLINSPQGAGGGGRSGALSPAFQPAPPAKEILQKLFQPFENRVGILKMVLGTNWEYWLQSREGNDQTNFPCLSQDLMLM